MLRTTSLVTFSPAAIADTTGYAASGYHAIKGASNMVIEIQYVFVGGQASAQGAYALMLLAYDSTVGVTPTALAAPDSDTTFDPNSAALGTGPVCFKTASTQPQRSSTLKIQNLSYNPFGGIIRKDWAPGRGPRLFSNAANTGEVSISNFTGGITAAQGTTIDYEVM